MTQFDPMDLATWSMPTTGAFSFDAPLEWRLAGTPDMVRRLLERVAREFRLDDRMFSAFERGGRSGPRELDVEVSVDDRTEQIGVVQLEELPGQRTRLRVPPQVGMPTGEGWPEDPGGVIFSAFLSAALRELRNSGFLAASSRFQSNSALETTRRELDAASDSASFANIGNSCRAALIALANDLFAPEMLSGGKGEPKRNDAVGKLKLVAFHYFAGRGRRYRDGLNKSIEGAWDVSVALLHRSESATREEAEAALALVSALFEALSFIVPPAGQA